MANTGLGYMATQYEKYGRITEAEVIEAYIDEELDVNIDMLSDYNEYLEDRGYEHYYNMDELDELLDGLTPMQVIQKTYFGKFNYSDEYVQFNGYANLDSFSEYEIIREMQQDRDFLRWYVEENQLIDDEEMQEAIEAGNFYLRQGA